ncbi:fimbrial protein [Acinetobacter ihumii]|uniref:fimbrial protein n=1 Tax=Acinetobacter ihumii TaxID=2483802 RepID=UPI0010300A32|nr:fimbrial protein [Acinetobacter ihumii]
MKKLKFWLLQILIVIMSYSSVNTFAACRSTGVSQTEDGRTAPIRFGTVNLTSTYLQPVGTLLAKTIVPPTDYTYGGATATSVLWECDAADLPNIQFLVATNGDDRVGGYWDLGAQDGLSDVYATFFRYIGIKQTMDGVVLTRYWKSLPVRNYVTVGNKIQIRLQDLPTLYAELYRISQIPSAGLNNYCGAGSSGTIATGPYSCTQPNAYIQLKGPGLTSDNVGQDSATNYLFWGVDNGFGYGMRLGNQLWNEPTCVARNATPLVLFNTMTVEALNQGQSTQAQFNVSIECSNQAVSGTASKQTAIGIQASEGAYTAAKQLGLVNAENGVKALLSDQYGSNGIAKGVGIFLRNSTTGTDMNFVGQPSLPGTGASNAGWYPYKDGAIANGSVQAGYTQYLQNYTAILKKLDGQTVEAGKVYATAYVLVKVQ